MFNKLDNESGAVLIITLAFMLVFTSLGVASIHFADRQNEGTEYLHASTEAFWLAEAGVQRALSQVPTTVSGTNVSLGRGNYDVLSQVAICGTEEEPMSCAGNRYDVFATGDVLDQIRKIQAAVGKFDIANAITSHGPISDDCEPKGSAQIEGTCDEFAAFTFEDVFGLNYDDVVADADFTYDNHDQATDNYNNIPENGISGVTVIDIESTDTSPSFNINGTLQHLDASGDPVVPTLLIIDTTDAQKPATIHFAGNHGFIGIIWVVGDKGVEFKGTSDIVGSVFIDGTLDTDTKVIGDTYIGYDSGVINDVANELWEGEPEPPEYRIVSWKECPQSGCPSGP